MIHPVLLRPECLEAADGDVVVAVLLSQIAYWCEPAKNGQSKLKIKRHNVYWIAKTREQWMAETGLTLKQYKRAIAALKARQIVDVKVMRFKGIAQSHLRLVQPVAGLVPKGPTGWSQRDHPDRSTYITSTESTDRFVLANSKSRFANTYGEKSTGEGEAGEVRESTDKKEKKRVNSCTGRARTKAPQTVEQNTTAVHRGWFMKAADILKAHQAPMNGSLSAYWKSRCALVQKGYQKPLTVKEASQLKQLHTYLGDQTKPVIAYAVEHWWKFATQAGASAGVVPPADPNIGFLLKYHAVAVNLLTPVVAMPPPKGEEAPVQLIATGTEEVATYVPSSQELTELLDGLKSP